MLGLHRFGHGDVLPVHAVSDDGRLPAVPFCCSEGPLGKWKVDDTGFMPQKRFFTPDRVFVSNKLGGLKLSTSFSQV